MRNDEIHPGDLIAGKYRVRAILGRSQGLLVEAFHTEFDQRVVIKVLLAGHGDEREIERFRREARILAKLESEHVARIIDVGTEPDGSFYLVRQYLEGVDLQSYLRDSGPMPLEDAVLTILMAAEALAETHSHGIIVRELQPSHMFLTSRAGGAPLVKITDFGTAKLMRDSAAPTAGGELTATAMFGLSPYSSPELVRKARNVDARTDVWSLGAVLYQLLAGHAPFRGETAQLMLAITKEEPMPLSSLRGDIPPEIDQILGWALAKDVDGRFKDVNAFAQQLAPFAPTEGQVLIDRIAQIADAARSKRRGGSVPPPAPSYPRSQPRPSAPPPRESGPRMGRNNMLSEDSVTNMRDAPRSAPPPPSFPSQRNPRASIPPAPQMAPAPSSRPSSGWQNNSPAPMQITTTASQQRPQMLTNDRRFAMAALAVTAIVLPVFVVLMFVRKSGGATEPVAMQASPAVTAEQAATVAAPAPTTTPSAAAETPKHTSWHGPAQSHVAANNLPEPAPLPAPAQPAQTAASEGSTGTLLAVAVGGNCAFSVNGDSKGTSSSIRIPLKPGTYSVTCKPDGGAARSKSVTIKSGETMMTSFKL